MSPAKRKRAPRNVGGRPARAEGASSNFVVRLSASERDTLRELAERLGCTEAEAARTAIREAVHLRFHERTTPGCELCAENERAPRGMFEALIAQAPAIAEACKVAAKEGAAAMRARKAGKRKASKGGQHG